MRRILLARFLLIPIAAFSLRSSAQPATRLQTFFDQNIGLTQDQIDNIRHGIPVVRSSLLARRLKYFFSARSTFTRRQTAI